MNGRKRRMVSPLVLALGVLGAMVVVQAAVATHPRPLAASPLRVPLVPAYQECTSPNRIHGPPLALESCNPPVQTSKFLTVGTFDANGANANSVGFFSMRVRPLAQYDNVVLGARVTDVRCKAGTSACSNANAADGADYTGELGGTAMIRITDHNNAVESGGGSDPATVVDVPLPFNLYCTATADTAIGSTCNIDTYCPLPNGCSAAKNGARTVVGVKQVQVYDGGPDGIVATDDNTLFMEQGVFIP
jgi:hypothetical protein